MEVRSLCDRESVLVPDTSFVGSFVNMEERGFLPLTGTDLYSHLAIPLLHQDNPKANLETGPDKHD